MAKRKTFYVTTDLFEADIPSKAKLVLRFLSRSGWGMAVCMAKMSYLSSHIFSNIFIRKVSD